MNASYPKLRKSFYNLPYAKAMKVAKDISSMAGPMNWEQYKFYMEKYDTIRARRNSKLKAPGQLTRRGGLVFAEDLQALRFTDIDDSRLPSH